MELYTIILISIGLAADSFAVSVSSGIAKKEIIFRDAIKIAFSLAFFQGLLPVLGWLIGSEIAEYVKALDHWIAFGLLSFLGIKMIWESLKSGNEEKKFDPLNIWVLLLMSIATSIDAFIVGLSFGFMDIIFMSILLSSILIGTITFLASMTGILFGKKAGNKFGKRMETIGGLILIGIGVKILIEHTCF